MKTEIKQYKKPVVKKFEDLKNALYAHRKVMSRTDQIEAAYAVNHVDSYRCFSFDYVGDALNTLESILLKYSTEG